MEEGIGRVTGELLKGNGARTKHRNDETIRSGKNTPRNLEVVLGAQQEGDRKN